LDSGARIYIASKAASAYSYFSLEGAIKRGFLFFGLWVKTDQKTG